MRGMIRSGREGGRRFRQRAVHATEHVSAEQFEKMFLQLQKMGMKVPCELFQNETLLHADLQTAGDPLQDKDFLIDFENTIIAEKLLSPENIRIRSIEVHSEHEGKDERIEK